jgi:hypothetical protein
MATRHWPLTPNTVRLIGTFKRGVPRNKSATFRVSGSADTSVLLRRWVAQIAMPGDIIVITYDARGHVLREVPLIFLG